VGPRRRRALPRLRRIRHGEIAPRHGHVRVQRRPHARYEPPRGRARTGAGTNPSIVSLVRIVGGGLAGCEAAWQLARRGVDVELHEMRPHARGPAHVTDDLAELVCSNSLRGAALENAVGLLKEELARLGSLIVCCARQSAVPAGGALAVDRLRFSALVQARSKLNRACVSFVKKLRRSIRRSDDRRVRTASFAGAFGGDRRPARRAPALLRRRVADRRRRLARSLADVFEIALR